MVDKRDDSASSSDDDLRELRELRQLIDGSEPAKSTKSPMRGAEVGYTMLAAVLVGVAIGYMLDQYFLTTPYWSAGMAALFICAGLYQVVKEHWK